MTEQEQAKLDKLTTLAIKNGVPSHLAGGLARYYLTGIMPGGFLTAVLSNDLRGAINNGDVEAVASLRNIIVFLNNNLPNICWGEPSKVANWNALATRMGVMECAKMQEGC